MSSYPSSPLPLPTQYTFPPNLLGDIRLVSNCEEDEIRTGLALAQKGKIRAFEGLASRQASVVIRWVEEYHKFGDPEAHLSQHASRPHSSYGASPTPRPLSWNHASGELNRLQPPHMHASPNTSDSSQVRPSLLPSTPRPRYWCTECEGHRGFQDKAAWIAHEQGHHRHERWPCDKCNWECTSERHFKAHHKESHGCQKCRHSKDQLRVSQTKLAFGCGFCKEAIEGFKKWTVHLAEHYISDGVSNREWDYSTMVMGLLKHREVEACWTALMEQRGYGSQPNGWPVFTWEKQTSLKIVDCLQLKAYESNLPHQLQQLLETATIPEDYVPPTISPNLFQDFSPFPNTFFQPNPQWG